MTCFPGFLSIPITKVMVKKWFAILLFAAPFVAAAQNIDLLILNKNYREALLQINRNLEVRPDAELYFRQANVYRLLSEPMNAAKSLENSIAIDSTNSKYLVEYADLQADLGNPYKAITFYGRAVDNSPDDLNLKYRLGKAYMNIEDYQKAFDVFLLIETRDSSNIVYNKQFGLAALKTGKNDLAIKLFESVLQSNPCDFSSYMNLILLYMKSKNAVNIVRTSDRALYFFPDNSAILLREANSLYALKEYKEATPPFEKYLARNDSVFDVLENYGICLYFNEDDTNAKKILEKCFVLNPVDQFVNFYLGLVYKRLADFPRSAEFLNMAIAASQPAYLTEMYHHLGQVYGLHRDFKQSIEAFQEAYKCNPLKFNILFEIATTYEEFEPDKRLALNYYSKYLKEAGKKAEHADYAKERVRKIKEKLFPGKK